MAEGFNPLTGMDYPDPDVIRVGDTYYMISTTMHFFPGAVILRSHDLIRWEICSYLYETLEHTPGETLEGEQTAYGHGMWAASLRYRAGRFYVIFIAHEWPKTFLFTAENIEGPWTKQYIDGIYHDPSLLFDDDGRIYIVYGNREICLTELKEDISGPKPGGVDRIILRDAPGGPLGYEGSHLYKINGKYVLFLIHSRLREWFRTEACFITDDLEGVWAGGDVLYSDLDGLHSGAAQGGIVDTPDGRWFAVLFQDRGAVGRIPVLVPVTWNQYGFPVFGEVTKEVSNACTRPDWTPQPLFAGDDFTSPALKNVWQFNHEPRAGCWETGNGAYVIRTDKVSRTLEFARNTLTQRTVLPGCTAEVTLDASSVRPGDVAGLCLLIGSYGLIGVTREKEGYALVMKARKPREQEEHEYARIPWNKKEARLRASVRFAGHEGIVQFEYLEGEAWKPLGPVHTMAFALDHFTGCRFGLFLYATEETGGSASFSGFTYRQDTD
ncbi:MAG: glycoside hydrolase 43 family protein [Clostridiales bacterium]|nr:glycoside hydrolase 43 family protein [Clostridiales bacterium]